MKADDGRESLVRALILALLCTAALCLAWRRLLLLGQVPVDGNVLCVTYPNWVLARSLWLSPRLPLWNPLRGMGTPHLADPITSALYPVQWALSVLPSYLDFLRGWVVWHTLLSAFFTAALARRWCDPEGPLISPSTAAAALLGGLNGFFMSRVVFPHCMAAASWLPAVLFFQDLGSPAAMGAAFALQWLSGYPSFCLLSVLFALGFALAGGRKGLLLLARSGGWALGLCAVQFFPFLEFLKHSSRGFLLDPDSAAQFSLPPAQLAKELLLPQWQRLSPLIEGDPAMVTFFIGTVGLGLTLWGVSRGGRRERGLFLGVMACLLISLGSHLPGYDGLFFSRFFRYPSNWLMPASCGMALLAAAGAARIPSRPWAWAAVWALAADLLLFAQPPKSAWARPEFLSDVPPLAREALSRGPGTRILHTERLLKTWSRGILASEEDYLLMKDFLAPSHGTAFGLEEVSNYQTMRPAKAEAYRARLADPGEPRAAALRDQAGIGLIIGLDEKALLVERGSIRLYRSDGARPRLFIPEEGAGRVLDSGHRTGRAWARVESRKPLTLVFSETSYPGWEALLDGAKAPLLEWDSTFMAVAVPPGSHEVLFRYRPLAFAAGLALTLATLALLALRLEIRF